MKAFRLFLLGAVCIITLFCFASGFAEEKDPPKKAKPENKEASSKKTIKHNEAIKKALKKKAATKESLATVEAALDWLKRHQSIETGGWNPDGFHDCCGDEKCPEPKQNHPKTFDVGITGLVLLAFLGHGQTHKEGAYKVEVLSGIEFLIKNQDEEKGIFGSTKGESWTYNHAIATLAICEALRITADETLKTNAEKAIKFILESQNPGAGWKYNSNRGKSDTSVTAWMVAALHSAEESGIKVPKSAYKDAILWFQKATRKSDGKIGYMRPGDNGAKLAGRPGNSYKNFPSMTAAGIYGRILCGDKKSNKMIKAGVKLLAGCLPEYNLEETDCCINYYYWYYGMLAMKHAGGSKFKKWNTALHKALIKNQCQEKTCDRGSFNPSGQWGIVGGRAYSTAVAVLALETPYR